MKRIVMSPEADDENSKTRRRHGSIDQETRTRERGTNSSGVRNAMTLPRDQHKKMTT